MEPDMMDTETPNYFSFLGQQAPKKKRKRGGLAGLWDRNKNVLTPLATGVLGLATGGIALPALAGAAMRGLDRPGKRGIGFDAKQGLRGAAEGAMAGSAGRGLGNVLRGGAGAVGVNPATMAEPATSMSRNAAFETAAQPSIAQPSMMGRAGTVAGRLGEAGQRGLGRALQFVEKNPQAAGMGLQAISGIMGSQEQRRIEEARQREERRRAENLARLAMPLYLEGMRGMR